jgi:hypothetical protein
VPKPSRPLRDLWVYLTVRSFVDSSTKNNRLSELRTKDAALQQLKKEGACHYGMPGLWTAYKRGEKVYRNRTRLNWTEYVAAAAKPPRAKGMPHRVGDAVRNFIIYDAVSESIKAGASVRVACRAAQKKLRSEWGEHLSAKTINAVFYTMVKHFGNPR